MISDSDNGSSKGDILEIYRIHVEMADRVSQRRHSANSFYLAINTAIFGGYVIISLPFFDHIKIAAISMAGVAICVLWHRILQRYKTLNEAKFRVICEIEKNLSISPYRMESKILYGDNTDKTHNTLNRVEKYVPFVFGFLHILQFLFSFPLRRITQWICLQC